jgi:hypothetical protein
MRIARQNHEVGADLRDNKTPELDVQIRKDVEFHPAAFLPREFPARNGQAPRKALIMPGKTYSIDHAKPLRRKELPKT